MSSIIYNKRAYTARLARGAGRGGVSVLGDGKAPPAQKKRKGGTGGKSDRKVCVGLVFDTKKLV